MRISGFRMLRRAVAALWYLSALSALNRSARRPYNRSDSMAAAFSLVELVLALGVAGFCLFAVFGLMPVGMQTNRNATSQTAATNIIAGIVADLRATPAAATTSPQFAITFGTDKTLYFDTSGQASTSLSTDSRYRLSITWNSAPTGLDRKSTRLNSSHRCISY